MKRTCSECLAYGDLDGEVGLCNRRSPVIYIEGDETKDGWPSTSAKSWCCEGICKECHGEHAHYNFCSEWRPMPEPRQIRRVRQG